MRKIRGGANYASRYGIYVYVHTHTHTHTHHDLLLYTSYVPVKMGVNIKEVNHVRYSHKKNLNGNIPVKESETET